MRIIHITLSFLFFFTYNFQDVLFVVSTQHLCRPEQKDVLLQFKNEFEISKPPLDYPFYYGPSRCSYSNTESWKNNTDCCYWDGIECDAKTGDVIVLDLSSNCLHGRFHSNTLQNLGFLIRLDLSKNYLHGHIPSSIGKLSHLMFLDLSMNHLSGPIPSSIGKLSHLISLILSDNQFSSEIPSSIGNLSHLEELRLSNNNLDGEIPSFFGSLNRMTYFSVGSNKLSGSFPIALLNLTNLSYLHIYNNQFTGNLPPNISLLSNLVFFEAYDNAFVGTLPSSLFNIPSLTDIILYHNQLDSTPEYWNVSSPSKLESLYLASNKMRGPIPRSISNLTNLKYLDLSHWNTQGIKVDFGIFSHLKSLENLDLSHLNTTIDLNAISSFSKSPLSLNLSGNHVLATNKSSVSDPPSQLIRDLYLSSCGITEFPELLRTQQNMERLDISNNKIKGQVPGWLWMLPNITYVNLSNNTFNSFEISMKLGQSSVMEHFFGSKNSFTGKIPSFICEFHTLRSLDLSDNNLDGSIPLCLENLKTTLSVLNLHQNHLSGDLPENVIFESLRSFDVGHNQLVGKLPRSLMNFSTLEVLNVESNRINDTFPFWLSSLQNLKVLVLRSNAFHGPIYQASFGKLKIIDISHNHFSGILPWDYFATWSNMSSPGTNEDRSDANYMGDGSYYQDSIVLMNKGVEMDMVRILTIYTALDFSRNRLEGEIPRSIGLLKELHVLNLSSNAFSGHIPSSMGNLTALESLDVSQNKLSGEIPQELGNLSFLAYMNFSHNQLVGLVPGGIQFRTQPCTSFKPNPGLFGPALDDACRDIHRPSAEQYETPEAEEEEEAVFSWLAAAIGFVPGIVLGLTIGYILISYKTEWSTSPFGRNKRISRSTTTH